MSTSSHDFPYFNLNPESQQPLSRDLVVWGSGQHASSSRSSRDSYAFVESRSPPVEMDATTHDRKIRPTDVIIAVMGITGSGKSTFIQHFSDQPMVEHGLMSSDKKVEPFYCPLFSLSGDRRLVLVDTPGFNNSFLTDVEVLRNIATFLNAGYRRKIRLTGIIYLHLISEIRVGGSALRQMRMFRKLCGTESMNSVALVTTRWDSVNREDGERREKELMTKDIFWKEMIDEGSKVFRQDRGKVSAENIIEYLIQLNAQPVFTIQKEMITNHLRLDETAAGQTVGAELIKVRKMYEDERREIDSEIRQALKDQNFQLAQELRIQRAEAEEKLQQERDAFKRLQANYAQLIESQRHALEDERHKWRQREDEMNNTFRDLNRDKKDAVDMLNAERNERKSLERTIERSSRYTGPTASFDPYGRGLYIRQEITYRY